MADEANVQQVLDTASKIVDATTNTEKQNTQSITPTGDTGNTNIQTIKQTGEVKTQDVVTQTTQTSNENQDNTVKPIENQGTTGDTTGTTPITTGTNSKLSGTYTQEVYNSVSNFTDYAKKLGYSVQEWNGDLYINNVAADWKSLGIIKDMQGQYTGTQSQYEQLLNNVKSAGYTSALDFQNYANGQGFTVAKGANSRYTINGKEVDFSQYTAQGMKIVNGTWVGTEAAYKQILKEVTDRADKSFIDYLNQNGMNAQIINGKLVINNKEVDWKTYGLKKVYDNVVGTEAQYQSAMKAIQTEGYTSSKNVYDYLKSYGVTIGSSPLTNIAVFNGKLVDLGDYASLKYTEGIGWGGTEEDYKKILQDVQKRSDYTLQDYASMNKLAYSIDANSVYINGRRITKEDLYNNYQLQLIDGKVYGSDTSLKKLVSDTQSKGYTSNANLYDFLGKNGVTVSSNPLENVADFNGNLVDLSMYDVQWVPGQGWAGSEETYNKILEDVKNRSRQTLDTYGQSQGANVQMANGYVYINGRQYSSSELKNYGVQVIDGKLYGTKEQFDKVINDTKTQGYSANQDIYDYLGSRYGVKQESNPLENVATLNGQPIDFSKYDLKAVNGHWMGSQAVYDQIYKDLQARASTDFDTYLNTQGLDADILNGRIFVNGRDVTDVIKNSGLELLGDKLYGTEAQFKETQRKIEEPYTYKSAFEEELQKALNDINSFQAYQTPQETLDLINKLVKSAQDKFSYTPSEDSALIQAQKEAERQVREGSAGKGMLYSSGTMETVARKSAELIPQFEQQAYNRYQQEQSRTINVLNAVMQWDQMQSDMKMDEFTMMNNKFNTIIDMDTRTFNQFYAVLEQRNADRKAALEIKQFELDKKIKETENAWAKVDSLGYVDEETSAILGVPVGTKASWLQQVEEEQKNNLYNLQKQYEYEVAAQQNQASLDRSLAQYKSALDASNAQQLAAQEYQYNRKIAMIK